MDDCNGCVHENGYNSDYLGSCETCNRNPDLTDCYYKEEFEKNSRKIVKENLQEEKDRHTEVI